MSRSKKKVAPVPGHETKRRSRKHEGLKPGKVSWVHGTKLKFFTSRADTWRSADEQGPFQISNFYRDLANLYILKYGYKLVDDEDLEEDVPDPLDPNEKLPGSDVLTKEEAEEQSAFTKKLRKRIAAWYQRKYRGIQENGKSIFAELLTTALDLNGPPYPYKPQESHFYSRKFYAERIKARYEATFELEVQRAADLDMPAPAPIKIRNEVTRLAWDEEPEDFKAQVRLAVEAEHSAAVRAWEATRAEGHKPTAEEMSLALSSAGHLLEPLAEALRDRFSMNVAIMLCGPCGDRGGAIEVRSVHAGTTPGIGAKKWYQFDPLGYDTTEKSFIKFSERCFTEEQRRARIVGPQVASQSEAASSVLTGSRASAAQGPTTPAQTLPVVPSTSRSEDTPFDDPPVNDPPVDDLPVEDPPINNDPPVQDPLLDLPRIDSSPLNESCIDVAPRHTEEAGGKELEERHPAWKRPDMAKWYSEMRKAHSAFALGEKWGGSWGDLVESWLDLEAACGYDDNGGKLDNTNRPPEVHMFLRGGCQWWAPQSIKKIGRVGEKGTYADDWWLWWRHLQPKERLWLGGMHTSPSEMTFGNLVTMHGRIGLMQVVASLLWWGLAEAEAGDMGHASEWQTTVEDVDWLLRMLVASGELVNFKESRKKVKDKVKGKKCKRADEDEEESRHRKKKSVEKEAPAVRETCASATVRPRPRPKPKAKAAKK